MRVNNIYLNVNREYIKKENSCKIVCFIFMENVGSKVKLSRGKDIIVPSQFISFQVCHVILPVC